MTLIHRWIVDLFDGLAAWFYRRKYKVVAEQLGRPSHEEDSQRRGLIILEIDGLAYDYFRRALRRGQMPYLARLLLDRKLRLARWRCGLPSTTPAAQAGIMYGNNWDIPGFRWYDKATGNSIMCKLPGTVRAIQEQISAGRRGLLRGGSSYTNMFDGDARLALFTLSAVGRDRVFENVRGLGFLILFAVSPIRVIKAIGMSLWTWLVYVVKRFRSWLRPRGSHFTFLGPLLEIFNNIIFREVTTFSVMVDLYRGMPAIYAAYTGYDEIAHHFGADSPEAFRALRALDKQIRQIDRMRQVYRERLYDLYILSDHGMTPAVTFEWAYGQSLRELIAQHTGQEVHSAEEEQRGEGLPAARVHFLLDEIRGLEDRPHWQLSARLLYATRRRLEERLLAERLEAEWDLSRRGEIAVRNSGSLSHIYFDVTPRQMDMSEIVLLYPTLVQTLVSHEGIGQVVGREGDKTVIASKGGTLWVGPDGQRLEGEHPLSGLDDCDWATEQIARLLKFPHAGDLTLLGAWDGERVVCFEEQVACHGGLGGPQDYPFVAFPPQQPLSPRQISNAEDMYDQLMAVYGGKELLEDAAQAESMAEV
ncbi:MAG: alkaline phosphatase family protein [Anaerolineae bacterium]|nr:alkaline phosphatase family protein [Anaerolineae bacterium]